MHPTHIGLCHYYVHLMEMSPEPETALPAADCLRRPSAMGHLLHMPSHIDVLVGDYERACESNLAAVRANREIMERCKGGQAGTFYNGYIAHDYHMLIYAAMLGGFEAVRGAVMPCSTTLTATFGRRDSLSTCMAVEACVTL